MVSSLIALNTAVLSAIREDTILISIMHINNELGTINDLGSIGKIAREKGIFFHVDAAQSTGKIAIDLNSLPVDLMSFSAEKDIRSTGREFKSIAILPVL